MVIGVLTVDMFFGEANSLKEKRRVLKSIIDRTKVRFNVSVAEIGKHDSWQCSTVGFSCISNDCAHVSKVFSALVGFIESLGTVVVTDFNIEML